MADYKIQLGVKLDTSDIQTQINKASGNIKPIELKIDAETKELTNTIKEALNSLSKGTKNALTLDTSKVEASLDKLSIAIIDIKSSLGTLDSKSGMNNLLSSINQIATALGKVENESDSLIKSLNALSKKNFKINLGLQMGGSNPVARNINFGSKVRNETLPELQKQLKAYEDYFAKYYEGKYRKGSSPLSGLLTGSNVWEKNKTNIISINQKMADSSNLEEQIKAYKKYISIIKEAASLKGIDVSSVASQFSTSAEKLVQDTIDIKTGAKEAEDNLNKLKSIFGSSVDGEKLSAQLDDIVTDLKEIKNALQGLLQNNAIDGLTQSFKEMSIVIKDITDNLTIFRNAFSNVGNGLGSSIDTTTQELKNNANVLDTFKRSLQNIDMDADKIDIVANRIKNLGVQIETLNQSKSGIDPKEGMLSVDIAGIDKLGNAVKLTQQYDVATGQLINSIDKVSTVHQKAGKSAETFAKQQKNAVSNFTNQINQLNRSATDQNANRPIKESAHLDSLKSKYQEIIAAIQKMGNASSATFDDERNEVKRLISEYKSLKSEFKNAENVSMDLSGSSFAKGLEIAKNRLREFKADAKGFSQVTQTVEQLDKAIEGVGDASSLTKFNDQLRVAKSELKAVKAEVLSNNDNLANKIRIDIETEKFENQVSQLHDKLDRLSDVDGSLKNLRVAIEQVDDAYKRMQNAADDESLIQAQKEYAAAVAKANNELKIQTRIQNANNAKDRLKESVASLEYDMLNWLKKNSKATKEYKGQIDALIDSLHRLDKADNLDQATVNGARAKFKNWTKDAEYKGLTGLNFLDSMKSKIKEYSVYFGAAELFMYAEQGLRSMFEQVKAIDSAMTELKKVTNETDEAYSNFLQNAATRSREIGTTIDGLVSSTADFARLGYGFEDAQGLAEVANIYAVVGDEIEGVEGATESLISTMAAFKGEMNGMNNTDFAMSIIDKFNEIGNNFAISSGGIGEALERSASSLMAANNTIDESIALITASNQVVQDPAAVGQALKTISMRIRGAKTELEDAGLETEGMVESTAKLRSEILALSGVDIMLNENEFKSTYQIMDELAVKWKDLTDIQQATVTELIAGKVFCQNVQKCA